LQLFSFGGYGLALAALALVVFGAYDSYPYLLKVEHNVHCKKRILNSDATKFKLLI